jgi:hypothetical protein
MKKLIAACFLFSLIIAFLGAGLLFGRAEKTDIEALKKLAPNIYIDCGECDIDYIRTEITFVNYVRDRKEAQIHILITTQQTGSGGSEYTLSFIGQKEFAGIDDVQRYYSNATDTDNEIRRGLVGKLKMGLMAYVARTPIANRISIDYAEEEKPKATADKWKSWVFGFSGNGYFNGEKSYHTESLSGSFSASKVTPEIKLGLSFSSKYERSHFDYEDQTIDSRVSSASIEGLVVKSLNDHWSVGAFLSMESSTFYNLEFRVNPAPAIEFDLYPYSQSTRRQLRFLYKLGINALRYREETIFDKKNESRWQESLSVTLEVKEKWGSVSTSLEGAHYFHDFSKNHLTLFSIISLQLFKGVNFFAFGGGSRVHDRLQVAKGTASLEEVLLRRRQLATTFDYFFSVGLSFTFGSIFSNVVNPRFGSTGESGFQIKIQ